MSTAYEAALLAVESVLDRVPVYRSELSELVPLFPADVFNRWLFSHCTVNLGWEVSVKLYRRLSGFDWEHTTVEDVYSVFREEHAGLYRSRPIAIYGFSKMYWADPSRFRYDGTDWQVFRNNLAVAIPGLGPAKTSFALELIYPFHSKVVCLDRHMFSRVFGLSRDKGGNLSTYLACEKAWCAASTAMGVEPAVVRLAFWDAAQDHDSVDYWAHVLRKS